MQKASWQAYGIGCPTGPEMIDNKELELEAMSMLWLLYYRGRTWVAHELGAK